MYITSFDRLFDSVWNEPFISNAVRSHRTNYWNFDVEVLENGKQQVTINTIGHNPKNITVDVTEEQITVKAKKGEDTSRFVKEIDLTFTVGTDYDGTKSEAKFENGLLTLLIDKKNERKAKSLKISY